MLSLEQIRKKREALSASLEQLIGQVNRVSGAIAVVDELFAETRVEEEMSALAEMQARVDKKTAEIVAEMPVKPEMPKVIPEQTCPVSGEVCECIILCSPPVQLGRYTGEFERVSMPPQAIA
jgi:hypothetical protein